MTRGLLAALALLIGPLPHLGAQPSPAEDLSPQSVTLQAPDGVKLVGRYFPGRHGKETVPIIILHGFNERASTYESLAKRLQSEEGGGHAVFVPDLRGHGESVLMLRPDGTSRVLKAEQLSKSDLLAMITHDLNTVKKYLLERHNKGELNIDRLCVIGSEMGAVVAMDWAAQDWNWPPLRGIRQGQDVKALVLLSPPQNFKGIAMRTALESPGVQQEISTIIFCGQSDRHAAGDARRLYSALEKYRPQTWDNIEEQQANQSLFLVPLETTLQGSSLLREESLGVIDNIKQFIEFRVLRRGDQFPWEARNLPTVSN